MINFSDRGRNPSMRTSRTVLDILQSHYPERLGRALIINIPTLINLFFKVIMPFVDPITREKVHFNPKVLQEGFFQADQLKKQFGGDREFEYVHEKYWPELLRMSGQRKTMWMEKWRELGGRVGLKEWDFKDGYSEKMVGEIANPVPSSQPSSVDTMADEKLHPTVDEIPVEPSPMVLTA